MPDIQSTSHQEEEQQGQAPGALDVRDDLTQSIEDMHEGPAKEFLLHEKKVMESMALAYLQPDEQVQGFGHEFLPLPLTRHQAILWKEKTRPTLPRNKDRGYEGISITSEKAQTLIEEHPRADDGRTHKHGFVGQEDDGYTNVQWTIIDNKAKSTIRLHLAESICFTIMDHKTTKQLWESLCAMLKSKNASNKVFLMKKLFQFQMKEDGSITSHLNEFNSLLDQLTFLKGLKLDVDMKTIFLLCSLPNSWDTFCTAISKLAPGEKLIFSDVSSEMLIEEIRRQSFAKTSIHGDANVTTKGSSDKRGCSKEAWKNDGN
ncbi:hypothetical protein L7F22_027433 [Adiantum nelumboides]|nr:hypothetical protein [Adiantum nelumboides]